MTSSKILVVEDDKDILQLICINLIRDGYRVTMASSFAEGLAALRKDCYDLLLTDYHLSDGLGTDLIRNLDMESSNKFIVAILMTGGLDMDGWGDELIADILLPKPFSLLDLRRIVKNRLSFAGVTQSSLPICNPRGQRIKRVRAT